MATTQEEIERLEAAIASGARRVEYSDKEIEYRSLEEMNRILKDLKNKAVPRNRFLSGFYVDVDKGL